jgi:hypothetical protein
MSPSIFTYKKLDNTIRDVVVDPNKTEEFSPYSSHVFTLSDDNEFWRLTPPETHTHFRVWDVENNGWRTLIKSRIITDQSEPAPIQRQNGVDYEEEIKDKDMETLKLQAKCWEYYTKGSSDFEWYKDNRSECKRIFEKSMNGHLIGYIDDEWMEKGKSVNDSKESFHFLYKKKDGTTRYIVADTNVVEFRAKIADKYPERYKSGMTHKRVWDIENEGWRTLNNNNIMNN